MVSMILAVNLWNPGHVTGLSILVIAFLLGLVHGITPDEHTWPITFSYSVAGYSTKKGIKTGLAFSAAFTLQRAIASELAYFGLASFLTVSNVNYYVYIFVGLVMALSGYYVIKKGGSFHIHLPKQKLDHKRALYQDIEISSTHKIENFKEPGIIMPMVHGFIAGWGFGAFALIIYTVLAPGMPNAYLGWVPGALFGLGTAIVQMIFGGIFGKFAQRKGLSGDIIKQIALKTAYATLFYGGLLFVFAGSASIMFPSIGNFSFSTGVKVHNLDSIGVPIFLAIFSVMGIGVTTLVKEIKRAKRDLSKKNLLGSSTTETSLTRADLEEHNIQVSQEQKLSSTVSVNEVAVKISDRSRGAEERKSIDDFSKA